MRETPSERETTTSECRREIMNERQTACVRDNERGRERRQIEREESEGDRRGRIADIHDINEGEREGRGGEKDGEPSDHKRLRQATRVKRGDNK